MALAAAGWQLERRSAHLRPCKKVPLPSQPPALAVMLLRTCSSFVRSAIAVSLSVSACRRVPSIHLTKATGKRLRLATGPSSVLAAMASLARITLSQPEAVAGQVVCGLTLVVQC
eukprot:TRINITY_DN12654_c2_g2_i3.p1 TRINITY_DN12654_c2_g2~~TRINITY_DN12654_c2_g2_i3.p1  ORF type:complete len:115 (-),score=10.85 TRINITY_DN12654_c2_g2_i3:170-514(-)